MRRVLTVAGIVLVLSIGGCPREVDEPEVPGGVQRCESRADCNAGAHCGVLRACVGGLCEAPDAGSLVIPCLDGGPLDAALDSGP